MAYFLLAAVTVFACAASLIMDLNVHSVARNFVISPSLVDVLFLLWGTYDCTAFPLPWQECGIRNESTVVRATVRATHWNKVLAKFHGIRKLNDATILYLLANDSAPNSIKFFAQCRQLVHNYGHKLLTATSSPPYPDLLVIALFHYLSFSLFPSPRAPSWAFCSCDVSN